MPVRSSTRPGRPPQPSWCMGSLAGHATSSGYGSAALSARSEQR
jgi:hypothetical protein